MSNQEEISITSKLVIPYNYHAGKYVSRFYDALEEDRQILGVKCPECSTVYFPPRQTCGRCFVSMKDWVELGREGVVTNYTVVRYAEPSIQPTKPPYVQALIKLQGADPSFVHLVDASPDQVHIGMAVKAVFSEEKRGNILDIKCFEPIDE